MGKARQARLAKSKRDKHDCKRDCSVGYACGDTCISRTFVCYDSLSNEATVVAKSLIAFSKLAMSSHTGQLYKYIDSNGKTWFAKKFLSIESSAWQNELKSYQYAVKLGIQGMLVKPKLVELGKGKMLLLWPMLEGQTLRDFLGKGGKLSDSQRSQLAAARQFDDAIRNADRNQGNVWVMPDGSIKLIDHDNTFSNMYQGSESKVHASGMTVQEAEELWRLGQ